MRYLNRKSGLQIDLGELSPEKERFFDVAHKQFRKNVNWFEFEQLVFSYTSPIFSGAKNRGAVVNDPLYRALKDMWLQLGIDQGFVAGGAPSHDRTETKARPSRPNRPTGTRDVEASREPAVSRRRGR